MGSLFRSEPMQLCQLFLQTDAAYGCVSELGELGMVQFKDLNPTVNAFQRKFVTELRRCEEMERKLRFLEREIKKDDIAIVDNDENPEAPVPREMNDLEHQFEKLENDIKEVISNTEVLKRNYLDLTELKHILRKTHTFFDQVDRTTHHSGSEEDTFIIDPFDEDRDIDSVGLLASDQAQHTRQSLRIGFVAGVILRDRLPPFERMLWRACRGNVLLKQADIDTPLEDPLSGAEVWKSVFLVFYQGDQLKDKIRKICDGFRATVYPCPETQAERRDMAMGAMTRIQDLEVVLRQTEDHRFRLLSAAAASLRVWFTKVLKMKGIYHTLNLFNFDVTQKCLIGECWCPVAHLSQIQLALRRATERSGSSLSGAILNRMETQDSPPTYHRTNKFTGVFQSIVDSYGVASYREVNPAPFTIISFPFLFSMMFGDVGHGILVLLAGLAMVVFERRLVASKSNNEIWNIFFGGRYIILLMGGFSVYAGLMYNDVFSKSINVFGSGWYPTPQRYPNTSIETNSDMTLDPIKDLKDSTYPFGIDPVWQFSLNKITFLNSFKMKISIIFGISQMFFGVVLSLQNHRYFKDPINIFCEFIPEMIFLMAIFGYLIILILYKWIAWPRDQINCAPSLLIDLINMFLINYPDQPCSSVTFYTGQKELQIFLLLVVVACVPWLLIPKPFLLRRNHRRRMQVHGISNAGLSVQSGDILLHDDDSGVVTHHAAIASTSNALHAATAAGHHGGTEFDFGDVFVHQCIHTIEYCLGCISHTASYLRLWALSLAHAELSEVLWNMVLHNGLVLGGNSYAGFITIFIIFTPWAVLTVCILLLMEGLSAFLHTLRLHWVEFQSKFYKGEGYIFEPFSFKSLQLRAIADD